MHKSAECISNALPLNLKYVYRFVLVHKGCAARYCLWTEILWTIRWVFILFQLTLPSFTEEWAVGANNFDLIAKSQLSILVKSICNV